MFKLKAQIKIDKPYTGKSKFEFWHKLKTGDVITLSVEIKSEYKSSGAMYSPNVNFSYKNSLGEKEEFDCSWGMAMKYVNNVTYSYLD